ncbi:bifunctional diguanylate cyclase/phosphodiesterase [Modestobacter muralis]|uniref:Bifunctional diguanylate cyclase/phosphodiesterase n=1 Tax=Modestobacter muralis TaxID=1608614 RepID=A0A6P0H4Y8_9ACTN|nr:bifunctional diguanylate cyclase/phosphodiesterase [Modestobacter muralis]NEK94131.1 bifunctional diguanylate cyclase/phosphodiesterase [Modestobacter muralis]NEN50898.1 bifunctional diguanylate cyclase/phosphodiesterase [Modestobacter muralis]
MSRRLRLLTEVPRRILVLVTLLAGLLVVLALGPVDVGPTVPLGLTLALQLAACRLLTWRARLTPAERALWQRLAGAAALLAGGCAVAVLVVSVRADSTGDVVPLAVAHVAAFPLLYGGMVLWNRDATNIADPSDTLLGVAAVLAVVSVTDTVLAHTGNPWASAPWWQVQPVLLALAAGLVVIGTSVAVPHISGMTRDPRAWLISGGLTADLLAGVCAVLGYRPGWALAALGVLLLCLAAVVRPTPVPRTMTDPGATTIGAFVVIISSIAVLVATAVGAASLTAVWCAGIAGTASGVRLLLNVRDLSQLAVSRREALTDELTGMANRRAVLRRVEELCADRAPLVLGVLDLDKFKEVNDGLGHAAGDDLLRLVAQRLAAGLGHGDVLGRLGGDEFALIAHVAPGACPEERAAQLGRVVHESLAEPFAVGGLAVHVAVSLGLTCHPGGPDGDPVTAAALMRQADAAMYDAKRSGSQVVRYDADRHGDSSGRLALVEELRAGIAGGELVLHHQPQVDVETRRTVGVEALVRWQHPTRGLLAPVHFLPLAEVHGLMGVLTDAVLAQSIAQAAAWHRTGRDLRISVNLSASNLLDTGLPGRVAELLELHALPPSALVLEVTETVLLSDPDRSLAVVGALTELGAGVSIDDFGTGYASLTYLHQLPVGELKLDRSFTADLLTDSRAAAIVASTIRLAHQLGLRVVAEGVEDPATLLHLRALDCDESQGYLHSPPLPAAELEQWLDCQDGRRERDLDGARPALR